MLSGAQSAESKHLVPCRDPSTAHYVLRSLRFAQEKNTVGMITFVVWKNKPTNCQVNQSCSRTQILYPVLDPAVNSQKTK